MMNHDRLSEVFHREILKQEEAQERKGLNEKHEAERARLSAKHEAERLDLREECEALKLAHNNEKIRIRWEHMDEVCWGGESRGWFPFPSTFVSLSNVVAYFSGVPNAR